MRSWGTIRPAFIAALLRKLHRYMAVSILLAAIACLVIPIQVLSYRENMYELVVGSSPGVIAQDQTFSTVTRQDLFHTATNDRTDTESFAFDASTPGGIRLAQTSSLTAVGAETGFFHSTASSDIVPPVHIGNGFLGTKIGDPLWTGVPIFAGMTFPKMTKSDINVLTSTPQELSPVGNKTKGNPVGDLNTGTAQAAGRQTANNTTTEHDDTTGNRSKADLATFKPVINNTLNDTVISTTAGNTAVASNATRQNVTAGNPTATNATKNEPGDGAEKPSPAPSLSIKPGEPFYHQQNKPFSISLTSPSGPFKATQESTLSTTGFDRFLRNTVGRSTTDKAFSGTTSSPTYITPDEALAEQIPYDFIQGALGMTMPGTHLNYRAWPL